MPPDTAEAPAGNGADFGLDADEQAAFDAMKSAPVDDLSHAPAPDTDPPAPEPPAALQADAPAPAPADDDDEPDDAPPADGEVRQTKRVGWTKFKRLQDEANATKAELATERAAQQKMREDQARLDERLRLINEALTPAPKEPTDEDPEPDPEKDIFAHNAWLRREQVRDRQSFDDRISQIETTRQSETAETQLASTYMDDAARFAQAEPNFGPAYSYLMQVRTAQLANFHFGKDLTDPATPALTPQEMSKIKSEVAREEKALVGNAIKAGKSPAQAVYAMARMTGYRPPAAAPVPAATNGVPAVNSAKPANGAPPAPPAPSVRSEIDRIKSAQDASLSLSHGGGTPAPVLDARKLADMPQDQFNELLESMSRGDLMRIMGGA